MNRAVYWSLWAVEILLIVGLVLVIALPQDYALREFFRWQEHRTPENYQAFLEKQRQERAVRLVVAIPLLAGVILLSGPLRRHSRKAR